MVESGISQMSEQNIPPIDSLLRQMFATAQSQRSERIEYLVMNGSFSAS